SCFVLRVFWVPACAAGTTIANNRSATGRIPRRSFLAAGIGPLLSGYDALLRRGFPVETDRPGIFPSPTTALDWKCHLSGGICHASSHPRPAEGQAGRGGGRHLRRQGLSRMPPARNE